MTTKCDGGQPGRFRRSSHHAATPGVSRRSLLQGGLASIGVGALGYAASTTGYVWWENFGSQGEANADAHKMVTDLHSNWNKTPAPANTDPGALNPGSDGTAFATIAVPRFGSSWLQPVIQGTTLAELGVGVGHVPGTAMPGQIGNCGLAGHRTTHGRPFNHIAELRKGDKVIITTNTSTYTYAITSHEIVKPDSVEVFEPVPHKPGAKQTRAVLTMSSCHPEYSAAQRYVVHGILTTTQRR